MKLNESILANLKEDYRSGFWLNYQEQIENVLDNAREKMSQDAFLDFCSGVIDLCNEKMNSLNESAKLNEEFDPLPDEEIQKVEEEFQTVMGGNGHNCHIHHNDKSLGNGGFCELNDDIAVKLHIFPYPKGIFIDVIRKYEPNIIAGKTIDKFELRDFASVGKEELAWVNKVCNEILQNEKKYMEE